MVKLLQFLKKIFNIRKLGYIIKDTENTKTNDDKEINLEEDKDIKALEKVDLITEQSKEIIHNLNIRWDVINKLKDYDIVFVKMIDDKVRNIDEEHKKRPFLITKMDDDKRIVSGYYFTGNTSNHYFFKQEKYKGLRLILRKDNYLFKKNSLVLINKEIKLPYENVFHLLDHMNINDLDRLNKYINLLNGNMVISNRSNNIVEIGDIVIDEKNNNYIIYQVDNSNCYGYGLKKHSDNLRIYLMDNPNYILFDNKFYYIDYSDSKIFSKYDNIHIVNRFNNEIVDVIKENKKKLKVKLKKLNKDTC